MVSKEKKDLLLRLSRLEGQIRGIHDMIVREEDCERVAQQLAAARGALNKAFFRMMACAFRQQLCEGSKQSEKLANLTEILSKYG